MYINSSGWGIDIMLCIGLIFALVIFLLIRLCLLKSRLTEYKLRLLIQDEINEIDKAGENLLRTTQDTRGKE